MTLLNKALDGSPRPLGVHSLDHYALDVPCLETAKDFYTSFGLDVREEADTLVLRAFGDPHPWAYLHQGARKETSAYSLRCLCRGSGRVARAGSGQWLQGVAVSR